MFPVGDAQLSAVLDWWAAEARQLPWRETRDVYAVWVSEVMLIQTQVERVEPAWRAWIDRWPTVTQLAAASLADVLGQWQGLGYPRRARDLHRSARIVARSGWPDDLTALPGVGTYVATAIRCFALEQPVLPIDVNVRRVLRRRFPGGVDSSGDPWRTGQALMEFGQRICTARPRCGECPVSDGCAGVDADPKRTISAGATTVRRQPQAAPRAAAAPGDRRRRGSGRLTPTPRRRRDSRRTGWCSSPTAGCSLRPERVRSRLQSRSRGRWSPSSAPQSTRSNIRRSFSPRAGLSADTHAIRPRTCASKSSTAARFWVARAVTGGVVQQRAQPVVFDPGDVGVLVDDDPADRLAGAAGSQRGLVGVDREALVTRDLARPAPRSRDGRGADASEPENVRSSA